MIGIFILFNTTSCMAMDEYRMKEIDKQYQQGKREDDWWEKYIRNPLYIGMPEDEFVTLFAKRESNSDIERPYILNKKGNAYIVIGFGGKEKYRFTFVDGLLSKYEQFGLGQNPFGYSVSTFLLKGYKANGPGFYNAMPEDEFLRTFSGSILSHSGNRYVVTGKNGRKYRVSFTDGFLAGMESIQGRTGVRTP
jgi:hypothetical protein